MSHSEGRATEAHATECVSACATGSAVASRAAHSKAQSASDVDKPDSVADVIE